VPLRPWHDELELDRRLGDEWSGERLERGGVGIGEAGATVVLRLVLGRDRRELGPIACGFSKVTLLVFVTRPVIVTG
jgi:hypothetical protein